MKNREGKKSRLSMWLIVVAVLAWIGLMFSMAMIADARRVRFYVSGSQEMTVEHGSEFEDPGIYAVSSGKLFGEGKKKLDISTRGFVDTGKLGEYIIEYTVDSFFGSFTTQRSVNVVDTTAPTIELKYVEGYEPSWITGYVEEGYSAHDDYDGDITDRVQTQQLADRIIYTVSDSSGNTATVERPLPDFSAQARLTLNGPEYVEIYAGEEYVDPGFTAVDGRGNDLSEHVLCEGQVINYSAGEYFITYSMMSDSGEGLSVTRCVTVLPNPMPETVIPEGRSIYLTFDDGPGPYTGWLLDILSAYGVKATFFVTAANPDYYHLIGRAHSEGHSIAVHTSSHNYSEIYASEEAWLQDFRAMQDIIYQQTGEYTSLFRFPGGSSNTVSRFNPGIMTRLDKIMTDLGYKYFDWNVSSGDAGGTNDTQEIVDNIIAGCMGMKSSIVLQHDIKDYSIAAVEQVIIWGLNNGYTFRALDITSPDAHHGLNN